MTKSSDEGHIFGPHLAKVRDVTKSSDEGHTFFGPYLVEVQDVTKSSNKGHIFWTIFGQREHLFWTTIESDNIWSNPTV